MGGCPILRNGEGWGTEGLAKRHSSISPSPFSGEKDGVPRLRIEVALYHGPVGEVDVAVAAFEVAGCEVGGVDIGWWSRHAGAGETRRYVGGIVQADIAVLVDVAGVGVGDRMRIMVCTVQIRNWTDTIHNPVIPVVSVPSISKTRPTLVCSVTVLPEKVVVVELIVGCIVDIQQVYRG